VSASSSRLPLLFACAVLCGCIGPWDGTPQDDGPQIRASVAVFVQQGGYASATFGRPLDNANETEGAFPWIDRANSSFSIEENSPTCRDSLYHWKSRTFLPLAASNLDWTYSTTSNPWMASCGEGRTWRIHGHLRWNASSPFSAAIPLWITDSVNATGEISTAPRFLRGNISGPLDLRWSTLAQADALRRTAWSRSPSALEALVGEWKALQTRRGLDASVLVLDTTTKPGAWRWFDLDTGLLHEVLVSDTSIVSAISLPLTVFSAGDTLWLPSDPGVFIQASVSSTTGEDLYKAVQSQAAGGTSLANIRPCDWPAEANSLDLIPGYGNPDTSGYYFLVPSGSGNPSRLEIAVAGTCPSQRVWLHEGGSNRSELPHGNVGPLDGFVCEVLTDTMSFPLGK